MALHKIPAKGIATKGIDSFKGDDAAKMDFIFVLCNMEQAAPYLEGFEASLIVHWTIERPSQVQGSDVDKVMAYRSAFKDLEKRINILISLPLENIDKLKLQQHLEQTN